MENFLTDKLPIDQQRAILSYLFSFSVNKDGLILDEEGDEFHAYIINDRWDLTTFKGIIAFFGHRQEEKGGWKKQQEITNGFKKLLDL